MENNKITTISAAIILATIIVSSPSLPKTHTGIDLKKLSQDTNIEIFEPAQSGTRTEMN